MCSLSSTEKEVDQKVRSSDPSCLFAPNESEDGETSFIASFLRLVGISFGENWMLCLGTVLVSVLLPFPQCQSDVVGTKIVTFLQFGWSTWVEKIQMLYSASRIMRHCSLTLNRIQSGAAGWGKGFLTCFLKVPQAIGLNCSCHAAQASKGNFQKRCYETFYTTCGPRLYSVSMSNVHCIQFHVTLHICKKDRGFLFQTLPHGQCPVKKGMNNE